MPNLLAYYHKEFLEAGCDEAGRGCLAGPVVASALILPRDIHLPAGIDDSKKLTVAKRRKLFAEITAISAIRYAVGIVDTPTISAHQAADIICPAHCACAIGIGNDAQIIARQAADFTFPAHCACAVGIDDATVTIPTNI